MLRIQKTEKDYIKERGKFSIKIVEETDSLYITSNAGDIVVLPAGLNAIKVKVKIKKKVIE